MIISDSFSSRLYALSLALRTELYAHSVLEGTSALSQEIMDKTCNYTHLVQHPFFAWMFEKYCNDSLLGDSNLVLFLKKVGVLTCQYFSPGKLC